ncbi:MAG: hypothetical protein JOZ11_15155 [Alphaproteobacteria bacterium]|nr:hypothetical protein [Alphaproteobacteria bacterium]
MREVRAVLFELSFQFFDQAGNDDSLLAERGNDMWIGHANLSGAAS